MTTSREHRMMDRQWLKKVKLARKIAIDLRDLGGLDLSHLSDEELVDSIITMIVKFQQSIRYVGVSFDDAAAAFKRFADVIAQAELNLD